MSAIELRGVTKRFGSGGSQVTAVENVSFAVEKGEVFGLLGPNGAGKTTLIRILSGLVAPTEGEGEVSGLSLSAGEALRQAVGLLTEQPGLYDRLSAIENLRFSARLYGVGRKVAEERIELYLSAFGLWEKKDLRAGTYSKGMRQKLAIARALLHAPQVIFLDEPTSGLDPVAARAVREVMSSLGQEGKTIILCSHNLDEVERMCRRVALIRRQILAVGPVSDLRKGGAQVDIELDAPAEPLIGRVLAVAGVRRCLGIGQTLTVQLDQEAAVVGVVATLVRGGTGIRAVIPQRRALEDVYLDLVGTPTEKAS